MFGPRFAQALFLSTLISIVTGLYYKDVTAAKFDKLLDPSQASILVEFYAPWCGHCQSLAPEYEKLGATFETSPDVIIAQVDADKHKSLAKRFGVKGYPTLKWVQKGSTFDDIQDVEADRSAEGLLNYVNKKTGRSKTLKGEAESHVIDLTEDSFDAVALGEDIHTLVGFFAPWCGHCKSLKPVWKELARLYLDDDDINIAAVDCDANPRLAEKYGVTGYPTLKLFSGGEAQSYDGQRDLESLIKFMNENSGADVSTDGGVVPTGGVVKEVEEHVKAFLGASSDDERVKILDTCWKTVEALDMRARINFKYYTHVLGKISAKGEKFIETEKKRLSKILADSESLRTSQKKRFLRRINVLTSFDEL